MGMRKCLFELIRYELQGIEISKKTRAYIAHEGIDDLLATAKRQGLLPLVADVLLRLGLVSREETAVKLKKALFYALSCYEKQRFFTQQAAKALEEAGIDHILLKGAVIRDLYPQPWLRTCGDIDVLVREPELDRAVGVLTQKLDCRAEGVRNYHDVPLRSKNGVLLELHFSIQEDMPAIDSLLSQVWEHAAPQEKGGCCYLQTKEYMVFYLVAHMMYHFVHGGCGIRPFVDLYLLKKKLIYDEEKVLGLCAQCGLEKFYIAVQQQIGVWFEGKPHTEVTKAMESYVIYGGTFGTRENYVLLRAGKYGRRMGYIRSRMVLGPETMKKYYPILHRHGWLLPFFQLYRWCRILLGREGNRVWKELHSSPMTSQKTLTGVNTLYKALGLSETVGTE